MKRLLGTLIATLTILTSQASTQLTGFSNLTIRSPATTATKNVQVLANIHKIPKFKIIRSNPYRIVHRLIDDDYDDLIDDDSIITSYRRKDLNKLEKVEELSDHVRWRLFLARQLALLKHKEVHG